MLSRSRNTSRGCRWFLRMGMLARWRPGFWKGKSRGKRWLVELRFLNRTIRKKPRKLRYNIIRMMIRWWIRLASWKRKWRLLRPRISCWLINLINWNRSILINRNRSETIKTLTRILRIVSRMKVWWVLINRRSKRMGIRSISRKWKIIVDSVISCCLFSSRDQMICWGELLNRISKLSHWIWWMSSWSSSLISFRNSWNRWLILRISILTRSSRITIIIWYLRAVLLIRWGIWTILTIRVLMPS